MDLKNLECYHVILTQVNTTYLRDHFYVLRDVRLKTRYLGNSYLSLTTAFSSKRKKFVTCFGGSIFWYLAVPFSFIVWAVIQRLV
jgi:hypothetical protein